MADYKELLLGCGHRRSKDISTPAGKTFQYLTTLDMYDECKPDILFDLDKVALQFGPLPFDDNSFNEIHAYDVMEHIGKQGEYQQFFHEFREYWRVLRPGGFFCALMPRTGSDHVWGDPGHRREINALTLVYLSKAKVAEQIGVTTLTDYRRFMGDMDFEIVHYQNGTDRAAFVLKAIKPT